MPNENQVLTCDKAPQKILVSDACKQVWKQYNAEMTREWMPNIQEGYATYQNCFIQICLPGDVEHFFGIALVDMGIIIVSNKNGNA